MQSYPSQPRNWADPRDDRSHRLGVDLSLYEAIKHRFEQARSRLASTNQTTREALEVRLQHAFERVRDARARLESHFPSDPLRMNQLHELAIDIADRAETMVRRLDDPKREDVRECVEAELARIESDVDSAEALIANE